MDVVVLPQPDSPTSPNVVPASIVNEIESTARTSPVDAAEQPAPHREVLGEPLDLEERAHAGVSSQQRATWPGADRRSGGASTRQRSITCGQRGANAQPPGSRARSGGWPSMAARRATRAPRRGWTRAARGCTDARAA